MTPALSLRRTWNSAATSCYSSSQRCGPEPRNSFVLHSDACCGTPGRPSGAGQRHLVCVILERQRQQGAGRESTPSLQDIRVPGAGLARGRLLTSIPGRGPQTIISVAFMYGHGS